MVLAARLSVSEWPGVAVLSSYPDASASDLAERPYTMYIPPFTSMVCP
jgi:hypothetical protein